MISILPCKNRFYKNVKLSLFIFIFFAGKISAQGTWTPVTTLAPDTNEGVMMLLTDGTVIVKSQTGGNDGVGNKWNKLTPDIHGSYVNGTWSSIAPMHDTRCYFSSQVLQDGRVYVAGGEYGTGGYTQEMYNPLSDTWSSTQTALSGDHISDANSELLDNGKILQALVTTTNNGWNGIDLYDIPTNTFSLGPTCLGSHDESAWVKLQDGSILFVDLNANTSERYIPSLNQWVADANVPVAMYDGIAWEMGGAVLLPDGRAFFVSGTGQNAIYTPSGNNSPGSWAAAAVTPGNLGVCDGACAMMTNGKILYCASPNNDGNGSYYSPTYFFEYDYLTDTFTPIVAPDGSGFDNVPVYYSNMLDLPDGNVLYCDQGSRQYYIYSPSGSPLTAGKPTIGVITQLTCNDFRVNGTLFNGISEGASYGDDWQMATNYPIIRLTSGSNVYYVRTTNWNSTGVMRGALPDSTDFYVSNSIPYGTYQLEVVANGIASSPTTFVWGPCTEISTLQFENNISVFPNPNNGTMNFSYSLEDGKSGTLEIYDATGKQVEKIILQNENQNLKLEENNFDAGIYFYRFVVDGEMVKSERILIVK